MIANQEKFNKKTFKETIDAKTKQVTIQTRQIFDAFNFFKRFKYLK